MDARKQALLDEINQLLGRGERLTKVNQAKHEERVTRALVGGDTAGKAELTRSIPRANSGFAKGGIVDSFIKGPASGFGDTGHPTDEFFTQGHGQVLEIPAEDYLAAAPKPATEFYDRFAEQMAQQFPTIPAMRSVTPPTPSSTIEAHFSGGQTAKYEPTSGPSSTKVQKFRSDDGELLTVRTQVPSRGDPLSKLRRSLENLQAARALVGRR